MRARGDALSRAQCGKTARFEVSILNGGHGELDVLISGMPTASTTLLILVGL